MVNDLEMSIDGWWNVGLLCLMKEELIVQCGYQRRWMKEEVEVGRKRKEGRDVRY
jgi:hypothetical protein